MKSMAIPPENVESAVENELHRRIGSDFDELIKALLTILVLLTTAVGFYFAALGCMSAIALFHVVFGTALAAAGASALNQWWERRLDALMRRTRTRPIPAGRMSPRRALIVGSTLACCGVVYLFLACNGRAAFLTAATILI